MDEVPMKKSRSFKSVIALLFAAGLPAVAEPNSVFIHDTSGKAQNNRPFSISRVFAQGEFPAGQYPQARVNGSAALPTQVDVKNTWPDGSLKHALVSFLANVPSGGKITVDFVPQSSPNNAGFLDKSAMLDYSAASWAAGIQTSAGSASARTMLENLPVSPDINSNQVRYWMKGPIVTQVIVEDRSPALAYDFGTDANKSLHPIFVLTFYPNTGLGVKVEYIVENVWMTKSQDQHYSLTLTAGDSTVFTKPMFNYIAGTRWRKVFWSGNKPAGWTDELTPGVNIDYNFRYLISTGAVPNYDTTKSVSSAAVSAEIGEFASHSSREDTQWCVTNAAYCGSYAKAFGSTGGRPELAPIERWFVRYLYTFAASLYPVFVQDALVSGRVPIHERDTDETAFFDSGQTGTAFGRPFSIDAHPSAGGVEAPTLITRVGPVTNNGFSVDQAHQGSFAFVPYLITGDWYYLEELYFWSAANLHGLNPCIASHYCRHTDWGFFSSTIQIRGIGWALRNLANTAFMAPDKTPEQAYYTQKLNNNIEIWEGVHEITDGAFPPADASCPGFDFRSSTDKWCWGRKVVSTRTGAGAPNPLGFPDQGNPSGKGSETGIFDPTKAGVVPLDEMWESNILQIVFGHIRELGFPIGALQAYCARWSIGVILDPASNPYHIGDYAYPVVQSNNGPWITSFAEWSAAYLPTYNPKAIFISRSGDAQFGYPHIAYAALSYTPGITTASGLSGDDAWKWIKANLPNQNLHNDNPMWAIVPREAVPRRR
jgi:hypothetical protein